ncbi:hypothetical protein KC842_01820 [Candidatus Nomurabacteria bacterium]|nr:hypothetical protein [Candidatus Nomurabacteria bacterium]
MPKTPKKQRKTMVVLDSHAIIHRAYHALPDFSTRSGVPTGALYGVSNMLIKIIQDFSPDYIVAAYDLPGGTFRHEKFDDYKAGRGKAEPDLIRQIDDSRKIFAAFGVPIYEAPGFEADDIIGTICKQTEKSDTDIIIASGDMDTLQLVEKGRVKVYTLRKGITDTVLYDEKAVKERFGFSPELLPDYKGLRGDPSDNIPGVRGIGEKTAETLISGVGDLESIYKKIEKDKSALDKLGIKERIINRLLDSKEEAFFSKELATIRKDAEIKFVFPNKVFDESLDLEKIKQVFLEFEFKSLTTRVNNLFGQKGEDGEVITTKENINIDEILLEKLQIAFWLIDSQKTKPTLEDIYATYKVYDIKEAEREIISEIKKSGLEYVLGEIELPITKIVKSMEERGILVDKEYLSKLSVDYHKKLDKLEKEIWKLSDIEFNINSPKQLGEVIYDKMGLVPSSGKRISKTSGGARSTRESELEKLLDSHPIIEKIFEYRELQKLLSTYVDTIPSFIKEDGRVHAKFNQCGTTTGRFSSQDPNMQNLPIKSELGKNIRNAFVATEGYTFLSFDYSQIELRIAALLSKDEFFGGVFSSGKDVHSAVASKMFGLKEEDVTYEMRRRAKVINFGILYGMGITALQKNLKTTRKEAEEFYNNYFEEFPEIKNYLEEVKTYAKKNGFTTTLFGRRRWFPELKSRIPYIVAMAERMAINAPIQGTSADIIKIAIKNVSQKIKESGLEKDVFLILQIHDELIFEVKKESLEKAKKVIEDAMTNPIPEKFLEGYPNIPIVVNSSEGDSWGKLA